MNAHFTGSLSLLFFAVTLSASADAWEQLSPTGSPPAARRGETVVWTGSEIIVWGGYDGTQYFDSGGRYHPVMNTWIPLSTAGSPGERYLHSAVWTGSEMIIWGGIINGIGTVNSGARYLPATDSWAPVTTSNAPAARHLHEAVWTGTVMIPWGGNPNDLISGRYNPATNSWATMSSAGAVSGGEDPLVVWTGSEMIVWRSNGSGGGRYRISTNTWSPLSTNGAPGPRINGHSAIWTGTEMIIWGGRDSVGSLNTGGRYHPVTNTWRAMTTAGATARTGHSAAWTGREMIVWGGSSYAGIGGSSTYFNTGARYDPVGDNWTPMTTAGAPTARSGAKAIWTGSRMLLWGGGYNDGTSVHYFNDTFSYAPDFTPFRITAATFDGDNFVISFPSETGRSYTLWQSDTMTEGTWTDTGLPALTGTGGTLTFTYPAPESGRLFVRVQAGT
jgi:hypothetical protein